MDTNRDVGVVILNFENWELTSRCIDCVMREGVQPAHIFIVDNASPNHSLRYLEDLYPEASFIRLRVNLGYAGGVNAGLRQALTRATEAIWVLNNDVWFEDGTLAALVQGLNETDVGIVGAVVHPARNPADIEAWGGGRLNRWLGTTKRLNAPDRIDYIAGTCMLFRPRVLEEVGLFDESYFFYLEDVDICLRTTRAGWNLSVAEDAHVIHIGGASSGGHGPRPAWVDRHHAFSSGVLLGKFFGWWLPIAIPLRLVGMTLMRLGRLQAFRIPRILFSLCRGVLIGRGRRKLLDHGST